ncbi:SHOCT domain-containing protein [Brachybacterium sp. YJGR34]|uniref:SHOCT domain-containing protein n=1 Tax=Brachybacterium sp. YJGR34 TaxID=2059911 RepID=UPI000E0A546E|nr:SHOCT domain-containing protein [Brachybacterium sp. YJGR34]
MEGFPLVNLLILMLWFFMLLAWIWLLISLVVDVLQRDDFSGWAKALWTFFLIVLPFLGSLIYLVAFGGRLSARGLARTTGIPTAQSTPEQPPAPWPSASAELEKLIKLREDGELTLREFETQKAKILGS